MDDDGDAFSIATDDSRLDENVPDVDPELLANPDLVRAQRVKQKEAMKAEKEAKKAGQAGGWRKRGKDKENSAKKKDDDSEEMAPELEMEYWEVVDELKMLKPCPQKCCVPLVYGRCKSTRTMCYLSWRLRCSP